jgi:hypothetical protein
MAAFDATILSTMAHDGSQFYGYQHAYYEAIFWATPLNIFRTGAPSQLV